MGFFLKKLISEFLMPLPGTLTLAVVGVVLWSRGRPKAGRRIVITAGALLWLASLGPVAHLAMRAVETRAPAFPGDSVDYVVVLGGGHLWDTATPPSAWLSGSALRRLTEGVAIATAQPWSRLVLSGWGGEDARSNAEVYADVAGIMGFPPERIVQEPRPMSTAEEARILALTLRGKRFALVTSAYHIDRAVILFRAQGLDPIPAPTGQRTGRRDGFSFMSLFPDPSALLTTRLAWHEVLGRLWARLTGSA